MNKTIGALIAALVAALAVSAIAFGSTKVGHLTATDGPGFTISMSSKSVRHGTYVITVKDKSNIHNFHLTGAGVNKKTSVGAVATFTWRVTLKRGTYKFVCDPHATIMKGTLKVT